MKFNFELNEMQTEAQLLQGENVILDAPTGSGKTEAILLNCLPSRNYFYFLPTITSCVFMYNRLKKLDDVQVEIKTSLLTESTEKKVSENTRFITITTPDPYMINYLKNNDFINSNLILDELDNYPEMVQSVLLKYIKDKRNSEAHVIVASATLSKELLSALDERCKKISYNVNLSLIKHKVSSIRDNEIARIIQMNPDKKIGIICNSISNMEDVEYELQNSKINYLYHHAQLDEHSRLENEKKLFENDFSVVISNDLISYSVDINFDILITECSDRLSLCIQRLGRNNRTNKKVNFKNLFILKGMRTPPFISEYEKEENEELLSKQMLSYSNISEMKKNFPELELPSIDAIKQYWEELIEDGLELNLRQVPRTFKLATTKKVVKWQNGKQIENEVQTYQLFKVHDEIPWKFNYPYATEEDAVTDTKNVVYIRGNEYKIVGKEGYHIIIEDYNDYAWGYYGGEIVQECSDYDNY